MAAKLQAIATRTGLPQRGYHSAVSSSVSPRPSGNRPYFVRWPAVGDNARGIRTDIANPRGRHSADRSESESCSERSAPRTSTVSDPDDPGPPGRAHADIAEPMVWRGCPDANLSETRRTRRQRQKKAKLSVTILMLFTPSSYLTEANASGGRTRFFCLLTETKPTNRTSPPHPYCPPNRPSPRQSQIAVSGTPKVLLESKNPLFLSK
jgi:hypothetical protein